MSKKKCFYCGFLNQSNSLFCEECGKKLEYICPKCGYVAHEATNFCVNCGEKFDIVDDHVEENTEEDSLSEEVTENEEQTELEEEVSEEEKETDAEDASESEEIEEPENGEEDINQSEEDFRICPNCHTKNELSALFCEGCGRKLIDDSDDVEETPKQETESNDEEEQSELNEEVSEEQEETDAEDASESEETESEEEDVNLSEEEYVRVCGYCHTENPLSALFCEGCGKKLIDDSDEEEQTEVEEEYVRVCGYCHTENPLSALFCEGCGKELIDDSDEEEQTEVEEEVSEQEVESDNVDEQAESNEDFSEEVKEVNEEDDSGSEETEIEEEDANSSEEEYVRVCGYCHTENPLSVVYCEGCGRRLIGDESDEQEVNFDEDEETQTEFKEESIEEKVEIGEGIHEHVEKIEVDSEETDDLLEKQTLKGKTPNDIEENDVVDKESEAIQSLKTTTDASEVLENLSDKNQKSKKKKILFIVLLLLLIIVAIGCYLFFCTDLFDKKEKTPDTEEKVELILVPKVVGEDIDVAKEKLEELSLKVKIKEEATDNLDDIGKVFEQDIVDKEVEKGTLITLKAYVSNEKVSMISVVDSNVEEAIKKLEDLGLKVIVKEEYSDKEAGTVIDQNKDSEDEIFKGSIVEIIVSKGEEQEENNSSSNENNNGSSSNNTENNNSSSNDKPVSGNDSENKWSNWVDTLPSEVNPNTYQIEEKTVYRYRTTETMESDQASMPGWNLSYVTTVTKGWSDVQRIQDVSDEQLANYRNDSNYQILSETKAYYKLDAIHCDKISGEKGTVLPSSDGTCPSGYKVHENWTTSPTNQNIGTVVTTVCGQPNLTVQSTVTKSSLMWTIQVRTTVMEKTYHYTRLTDWSAWQDEKVDTNDNRQVETKKMYRYRKI